MLGSIFLAACTLAPANLNDIHLKGFVADRLNACIERHVERTDSLYLTRFFHARQASASSDAATAGHFSAESSMSVRSATSRCVLRTTCHVSDVTAW